MKLKSVYVVLAVGIIFVFSSFFRLIGFSVPSLVVALISVIAALISLSDLLEITKYKKNVNAIQFLALVLLIVSMIIWLFLPSINFDFVTTIGDSFTILGLGLVIGFYGLKEILEHNLNKVTENSKDILSNCKFKITLNEYEEMMKINDIIERLKKLDQDIIPYNKLHNGWSFLSDSLAEQWNSWEGPFFDGINRKKYYTFLLVLDSVAEQIGNTSDAYNYRTYSYRNVEMWNETIEITIQPKINNRYAASMKQLTEEIHKSLLLWQDVKDSVIIRYEKERSEQKKNNNPFSL